MSLKINMLIVFPSGSGGYSYLYEPLWWVGMITSEFVHSVCFMMICGMVQFAHVFLKFFWLILNYFWLILHMFFFSSSELTHCPL